jgi:hypothetical protein
MFLFIAGAVARYWVMIQCRVKRNPIEHWVSLELPQLVSGDTGTVFSGFFLPKSCEVQSPFEACVIVFFTLFAVLASFSLPLLWQGRNHAVHGTHNRIGLSNLQQGTILFALGSGIPASRTSFSSILQSAYWKNKAS